MIGDHIQEKTSNWDIRIYPYISIYISLYIFMQDIHIHLCQSHPINILYILFYPSFISRKYIPYDIQLWHPYFIQIYPFVFNKDVCFRYPWCYPIWLSWIDSWSSNSYPFISQQLSFHIITVILSYLVIYPWMPIKGCFQGINAE